MSYYEYEAFTLPTLEFVGGETQTLIFNLFDAMHNPVDLPNDTACNFAVVGFTNPVGGPLISKTMDILHSQATDMNSMVRVIVESDDTVDLAGKYIYQITLAAATRSDIPKQGIMYITRNINPAFLK